MENVALDVQINEAECVEREVAKELEAKKLELAGTVAEHEDLVKKKEVWDSIVSRFSASEIEEARELLQEYNAVRDREKNLKASSKAQLMLLVNEIQSYQEKNGNANQREVEESEEALSAERLRLAEVAQRVAALQNELDNIPSQTEMSQYQQRFIELYIQMGSKHRQARQYVTLYNTLVDVRNYIKKDIELLSKIEDVLPLATQASYQDSFINNLNDIFNAVSAVQKKVLDRTTMLTTNKTQLTSEYNELKEKTRKFNYLVAKVISVRN
ncbi:hypothetical protein NECAME_13330 [Necator americanus]|uniref:Coiled-coil domain-containing protein 93 n=1 Tax=Necator americanus TaxID=51031 RepID=W2SWA8_NECAM|nr:hypothetical protein NECAME_13330 [Necator americanus]ETN73910.1 hypothetical protein NECAME_13330 [Necator americanus]